MTAFALAWQTPASWATAAAAHVDTLLLDQAHLEKKAAAGAHSFLFRVPTDPELQLALSRLSREELVHFERTIKLLQGRGVPFAPLQPSPYMERLKQGVSRHMPQRLGDELLLAALIEARSFERMTALGQALQSREPEVAAFYLDLVEAEGRHVDIYAGIAIQLYGAELVAARWQALAAHEAAVLQSLPFEPRLHAGAPGAADGR